MDKLHRVKALPILSTVMSHSCNVRMMNLRGRAGFAQESRTSSAIFRQLSTMTSRATVELRTVSRARCNRHCPGAEYDRVAVWDSLRLQSEHNVTDRVLTFIASLPRSTSWSSARKPKPTRQPRIVVRPGTGDRLPQVAQTPAPILAEEPRRSCGQNPENVMQLVTMCRRIGNGARHLTRKACRHVRRNLKARHRNLQPSYRVALPLPADRRRRCSTGHERRC